MMIRSGWFGIEFGLHTEDLRLALVPALRDEPSVDLVQ